MTLSNITQADYNNYPFDIQPIELELINKAKTDKSLIDQAEQDDQVTATLWLRIT